MPTDSTTRRAFIRNLAIGAAACASTGALDSAVHAKPSGKLPRTNPEAAGMSPAAILAFVDAVEQKVGGLHSFMLLRHGKVVSEAWWAPYAPQHPHMLFSLSKSFTSTA